MHMGRKKSLKILLDCPLKSSLELKKKPGAPKTPFSSLRIANWPTLHRWAPTKIFLSLLIANLLIVYFSQSAHR
jgi:hypothetical protein